MEKSEFIEKSHPYFILAVLNGMNGSGKPILKDNIIRKILNLIQPSSPSETRLLILLLDYAMKLLSRQDLLVIEGDEFGPPLILRHQEHARKWAVFRNTSQVYARYVLLEQLDAQSWLETAIKAALTRGLQLKLEPGDFDDPDEEWKPLAIDRGDEAVKEVIGSVDAVIAKIEEANEYAVKIPEERALVLDSLRQFSVKLKTASFIAMPYIRRFAVEPLAILSRRFAEAAPGLIIETAKEAIKQWLARYGIPWFWG